MASGTQLGSSVAFDTPSTVALVGASREGTLAPGSGAVFVFSVETGRSLRAIRPLDPESGANFGSTLSSGSGDLLLVGAPSAYSSRSGVNSKTGVAYLMEISTGIQRFRLSPPIGSAYDEFGAALALRGSRALIGARSGRYAYLFDTSSGTALRRFRPDGTAGSGYFGQAVAMDAARVFIGASRDDQAGIDCGAVFVFNAASGAQMNKFISPAPSSRGHFGYALAMNDDLVLVGAPGEGSFGRTYTYDGLVALNTTQPRASVTVEGLEPGGRFGSAVDLRDGHVLTGAPDARTEHGNGAGHASLFSPGRERRQVWSREGEAADEFGSSVAAGEGGIFLAGIPSHQSSGPMSGAAFLFRLEPAVAPRAPSPPALPPSSPPPSPPTPPAPSPSLQDSLPMLVFICISGIFTLLFALVLLFVLYKRATARGARILGPMRPMRRANAGGQSTTRAAKGDSFHVGQRVVIVGLSGRPELNSVLGDVTAQRNERGRYIVRVVVERREEQVAVKAENLRRADVEAVAG